MKQLFFFAFCAALYSCSGGPSTEPQASLPKGMDDSITHKAMQDTSGYTSIQWIDSVNQDLGKVAKGAALEISWRFKNTGSKPLVIADVRPGCGCTLADRPEAPVAPGKEGIIRAKYDTKSQHTGVNEKNVTVTANTTGSASHLLTFKVDLTEN